MRSEISEFWVGMDEKMRKENERQILLSMPGKFWHFNHFDPLCIKNKQIDKERDKGSTNGKPTKQIKLIIIIII